MNGGMVNISKGAKEETIIDFVATAKILKVMTFLAKNGDDVGTDGMTNWLSNWLADDDEDDGIC